MSEISLYIHIPFCVKKCLYCDFLSFAGYEKYIDKYIAALIDEIRAFKCASEVKSIFFGGGTPSVIDEKYTVQIMHTVKDCFSLAPNVEATIEANPGTINERKLAAYRACGINRISFGIQAMQDNILKAIGRIHTRKQAVECIELAKSTGFENINCDLMFSLPSQTCEDFLRSADEATALGATHISAYSLIIEENTPFYDMYRDGILKPVDDDEDRLMYHSAIDLLAKKGYHQYEISNFAKTGYECRHNLVYWRRGEYKGFGLGSASLINEVRYKNTENLAAYLNGVTVTEKEPLTLRDRQGEFMFLGLRCNRGVSKADFCKLFGMPIENVYGAELERLVKQGLLTVCGDNICLTSKGFDLANIAFEEFI